MQEIDISFRAPFFLDHPIRVYGGKELRVNLKRFVLFCAFVTASAQTRHPIVLHAARMIDVEWDGDAGQSMFIASIEVKALDRSRLLRDVSNALSDHHVNIVACSTHTGTDRISRMRFDFELADPSHLDSILAAVKRVDSVYDAARVLPGARV